MAQQYATGAIHVFLKDPDNTLFYFGTTESMPQETRQPEYEPLMNDLSGSKVPLDFAFQGESAQISLVMTRWNENVAIMLENKPFSNNSSSGSYAFDDVGSLMGLEGHTWELYLVRTFGATLANVAGYVSQGLRPGRHYRQCIVWAPETEEQGTKPMKRHFQFYAWPQFDAAARRFVLYDFFMTGINLSMII